MESVINQDHLNNSLDYPVDEKILEFYKYSFEAVYILLHLLYWSNEINFDENIDENCPSHIELIQGCEVVTWNEVLRLTDFDHIFQIHRGLRTSIGRLCKDLKIMNILIRLKIYIF